MGIPFFRPSIGDEELEAVVEVLKSGWLTSGPKMKAFEEKFAAELGPGVEAVAVNSATAGLHLAIEACGIGPGDSVLVPTLTFTATAEVVRYVGAEVVLVDSAPETLLIDLEDAERRVTPQCKAIMPVHFGGLPCDMESVMCFARRHGLKVIEDAAHAFPAHRDGRAIGSWETEAAIFSFYANKTITTGEGGMLATRCPEIAARARLMRTHGIDRDAFDRFKIGAAWAYDVVAPGFKYNMTDLAAAIGIVQLAKARSMRDSRERAATLYFEALEGLPLNLPPRAPPGSMHSWHIFPVWLHEDARATRDEIIAMLSEAGICTSVHYRPLHLMSYWRERYPSQCNKFPVAENYFARALTLPLYPDLQEAEIDCVVAVLRKALL